MLSHQYSRNCFIINHEGGKSWGQWSTHPSYMGVMDQACAEASGKGELSGEVCWLLWPPHPTVLIISEEQILMKTCDFASLLHGSLNCILDMEECFLSPTDNSCLVSAETYKLDPTSHCFFTSWQAHFLSLSPRAAR